MTLLFIILYSLLISLGNLATCHCQFTEKSDKFIMSLSAIGLDDCHQLGVSPNATDKSNVGYVDTLTQVPFDLKGVQCISTGHLHTIIIRAGKVFAAGCGQYFGSDSRITYEKFTEINISEEPISWAACGLYFTIYLTGNGKVILCSDKVIGERISINLAKKAVSVFAGRWKGGAIDEEGAVHIFDYRELQKSPKKYSFEAPAIDLVICNDFRCVLTLDDRVFINGSVFSESDDFFEVTSLAGLKIQKISGKDSTCAALTADGKIFICGRNDYGQFGNGKKKDHYSRFIELRLNEEIKDVSCSSHTLFLTKTGKIIGSGFNTYCQLFQKTNDEILYSPVITPVKADQVFAGCEHSFILSGIGKIENPAKSFFKSHRNSREIRTNHDKVSQKNQKSIQEPIKSEFQETPKDDYLILSSKIDSILAICQAQSQSIAQLSEICRTLQQQNESAKKEIRLIRAAQQKLEQTMNSKLDQVLKYINEQDYY